VSHWCPDLYFCCHCYFSESMKHCWGINDFFQCLWSNPGSQKCSVGTGPLITFLIWRYNIAWQYEGMKHILKHKQKHMYNRKIRLVKVIQAVLETI
jgi:hypothetical protein